MAKILVDAFGGDNAPLCNIQGAADAVKELGAQVILVGKEEEIRACAKENNIDLTGLEIRHADDIMDMHDTPTELVKSKRGTSMGVAMDMLVAGEGDALVSAGSTGALMVGGTLIAKRVKGVKRPALAGLVPTPKGAYLLLDCGANADCRPEMLLDFAFMGSFYMEQVEGIKNPTVGLLNIGTEDTKGDELRKETYALLKESGLNFVGNVEAREVPGGACHVLVTDGFSGNVVLKLTEGVAITMLGVMKKAFLSNLKAKIGALLVKPSLRGLKGMLDASEHGGAPLLGVRYPIVKAHGNADARVIRNTIGQAMRFADADLAPQIEAALAKAKKGE